MAAPNAGKQADLIGRNLQMREMLKRTSWRMQKDLGTFTTSVGAAALGSVTRIKLYNVGLITRILLRVRTLVDIGTADVTLSPKGPFNLIKNIKVTDYDGFDRINCSGHFMWLVNALRRRTYWGYNNEAAAAVLTNPNVGLTVGADRPLEFFLEIPLAYDEVDLRGVLLAQTAVGEAYLTLTVNTQLLQNANADAVYNGAGTSTAVIDPATPISFDVLQEYIYPQELAYIPPLDVSTVYEILGNIDSNDNLAAGTEKLVSLSNLRSVIGWYANYVNNGVMNSGSDVSRFRMIANGNNILFDRNVAFQQFLQREYLNSDVRPGMYFFPFRERPIETYLYGNVQIGFTPSAVTPGNTKLEMCTESFYPKGIALPGVPQGN